MIEVVVEMERKSMTQSLNSNGANSRRLRRQASHSCPVFGDS
jgi:hypothetical protein